MQSLQRVRFSVRGEEATNPAVGNFLQHQDKFDDFIGCDNNEGPRQTLDITFSAERYVPSTRPYRGPGALEDYPFHDLAGISGPGPRRVPARARARAAAPAARRAASLATGHWELVRPSRLR